MAKIAYLDHSYHRKTASTNFLASLLISYGHEVDFYWDESWQARPKGQTIAPIALESLLNYDAIVLFQSLASFHGDYYAQLHPNVTYVPMFDQFNLCYGANRNYLDLWSLFKDSKILSFSKSLHSVAKMLGITSFYTQYYQEPISNILARQDSLHGFLWLRRQDMVSWSTIRSLISNTAFAALHIHVASDPFSLEPVLPSAEECEQYNITLSTWFEDKSEFRQIVQKSNVYFAPRNNEGIGQSFLEAFTYAQCVVAPNFATMNEYIVHGLNGLLYDPFNPKPLNFADAIEIGKLARYSAILGYQTWQEQSADLVNFIVNPV